MNPHMELSTAVRALRAIREQKLQEVNEIDRSIADFLRVLATLPEGQALAHELGHTGDRFASLSTPKAAQAFLLEVKGEPATSREIAEALLRGGIKTTAKNFEATIYSRLHESTSPKFRRTPDGRGWWIAGRPLPTTAWGVDAAQPDSVMGAKSLDGAIR